MGCPYRLFAALVSQAFDGIAVSAQRIMQAMKTTILARRTILELFSHEVLPDIPNSIQLRFQRFGK